MRAMRMVLASELRLLDRIRFSDLGTEVEYPAHSEGRAEMKRRLEKTRCAHHGREEEKQSPWSRNAEDEKDRPQQHGHRRPDPAALPSSPDLGRPDVADAGYVFRFRSHGALS